MWMTVALGSAGGQAGQVFLMCLYVPAAWPRVVSGDGDQQPGPPPAAAESDAVVYSAHGWRWSASARRGAHADADYSDRDRVASPTPPWPGSAGGSVRESAGRVVRNEQPMQPVQCLDQFVALDGGHTRQGLRESEVGSIDPALRARGLHFVGELRQGLATVGRIGGGARPTPIDELTRTGRHPTLRQTRPPRDFADAAVPVEEQILQHQKLRRRQAELVGADLGQRDLGRPSAELRPCHSAQ